MKKFVSLFLIFSLLALSGNLIAKERRGAELVVQKKDGQIVRGELIAVKENSLLMLVSGVDLSVDIRDVKVITIVKKSKILEGAGTGLLVFGGVGALLGLASGDDKTGIFGFSAVDKALLGGSLLGIAGLVIGGICGALSGTDRSIKINPELPQVSKKILLDSLRSKARIPDYQ
jgi:hypothetical protein